MRPKLDAFRTTKHCKYCGKTKRVEDGFRFIPSRDLYFHKCKDCAREELKERRKKPGTYAYKEKRKSIGFRRAKHSAKSRGYSFTLSLKQFNKIKKENTCFYCKKKTERIQMDRINNDIGYEIENIVPCCAPCNRLKGVITKKDIPLILRMIEIISTH